MSMENELVNELKQINRHLEKLNRTIKSLMVVIFIVATLFHIFGVRVWS